MKKLLSVLVTLSIIMCAASASKKWPDMQRDIMINDIRQWALREWAYTGSFPRDMRQYGGGETNGIVYEWRGANIMPYIGGV